MKLASSTWFGDDTPLSMCSCTQVMQNNEEINQEWISNRDIVLMRQQTSKGWNIMSINLLMCILIKKAKINLGDTVKLGYKTICKPYHV